jgi:hypothetical protein
VDDVEPQVADGDAVAVVEPLVGRDRQLRGVVPAGRRRGSGRRDDVGERAVVVPVPVRGDDARQATPAVRLALGDERQQPRGVVRGVDQELLAGGAAGDQIAVVVHLRDADLADHRVGQLPHVRGAADQHLTRVRHGDRVKGDENRSRRRCTTGDAT